MGPMCHPQFQDVIRTQDISPVLLPVLHPYYMPGLDLDPRPLEVKKAVLRGTQRRLPVVQC